MPFRWWPVASSSPSSSAGPISGRLSGVPGRSPAKRIDQLQLGDLGEGPVGLAEQLVGSAGRHADVEPALLDRRPYGQPPVHSRDQVHPLRGDDALARRRVRAPAQGQHLALDRAHRRPRLRWQPRRGSRPGPGRQHHVVCAMLAPVARDHPGQSTGFDQRVDDLALRRSPVRRVPRPRPRGR